jgi:hypothetical protein
VCTCSELRLGCPDLIGKIPPASPLPGTFSGTLSERVASQARLNPRPALTKTTSAPSTSVQPICFLTLTDSSAQRLVSNDFLFNHFRTLFTATGGVPHFSLFVTSLPNHLLTSSSLSPLAATFTCPSRMCCKQQTYVRLTSQLNLLAATLTKNTGGRSSLVFQCSNAFQRVSSTYLLSFQILAHSLARRKNQPFCFQAIPHSLPKTPGGGGPLSRPYLSLAGACEPARASLPTLPLSTFNFQLSTLLWATSSTGHGTRITHARAICRIHYLSRRRASDVLLEAGACFAKLFPGHSSVVSKYVYYVGGCDG